ncbi:MAG: hypothetical protein K6B14_08335 [Lachnospiraceae bacterium]|nr:hypothetical protein [Lachnospiraceae bacterium]
MPIIEVARMIEALKALGLTGDEINDFILFIGKGEPQYMPKNIRNENNNEKEEG